MGVLDDSTEKLTRPELEEGLLGWALSVRVDQVPDLLKVCEVLAPEDFSIQKNSYIFAAVADMAAKGEKPDLVNVSQLMRNSKIDISSVDLVERMNSTIVFGFDKVLRAAQLIKGYSTKRQTVKALEESVREAYDNQVAPEDLLAKAEGRLLAIADTLKDDRPTGVLGVMVEADEQVKKFEALGRLGFNTGFQRVDDSLGGLIPSHIWVVGAYTGTGKTFLTIQMLLNILSQGGKVALFSTEMDRVSTYLRILGNVAGIPALLLMRGNLDPVFAERKRQAEKILKRYEGQLEIYDNVYTVEQIRMKCKRQQLSVGLDVFFLDFVQNLQGPQSIYERMSSAAVDLQQLCKELNVTGVLLSQVANESGSKANADVIQYKGAGELAAVADAGLWLNKSDTPGKLQLLIRKSRHGASGIECYIDIDYKLGGRMKQGYAPVQDTAEAL